MRGPARNAETSSAGHSSKRVSGRSSSPHSDRDGCVSFQIRCTFARGIRENTS